MNRLNFRPSTFTYKSNSLKWESYVLKVPKLKSYSKTFKKSRKKRPVHWNQSQLIDMLGFFAPKLKVETLRYNRKKLFMKTPGKRQDVQEMNHSRSGTLQWKQKTWKIWQKFHKTRTLRKHDKLSDGQALKINFQIKNPLGCIRYAF